MKVVNANLYSLVRIPSRFSKQRWYVTLRTTCLAVKDCFSTISSGAIKTAFGRLGRRDRQLIKLKRTQFCSHHVYVATFVSETRARSNRILQRVIQTRIVKSSLPLQL